MVFALQETTQSAAQRTKEALSSATERAKETGVAAKEKTKEATQATKERTHMTGETQVGPSRGQCEKVVMLPLPVSGNCFCWNCLARSQKRCDVAACYVWMCCPAVHSYVGLEDIYKGESLLVLS